MSLVVEPELRVDLARQTLTLWRPAGPSPVYGVSTGLAGCGELRGSGRTPRGRHRIRLLIGTGCPENCVFVGRRPTGEIYDAALAARFPERDWILTRILWLTGLQSGFNRGGLVDTLRRFIYIHGCPDSEPLGVPRSHGCVRMSNRDILELFPQIQAGTLVDIRESWD